MSAPNFSSANAYIGEQFFTLTFDTALDAAHPPQISSFFVQVNGTYVPLASVAVDSTAQTVTLVLSGSALTAGDIVDFYYTDPTAGNDINAIQGLDGADAATFNNSYVVAIGRPGPSAPATPVLSAGSDSGTAGDGITNVTAPTVTGTAAANATVKLYDTDGTTLLGTTTADSSGNWSITSSTLAEGAHTLTARQTDSSNNTSPASSGLSLTIDTTAPSTPSTAPVLAVASDSGVQGDNITNVTTPTITGTADPGSTVKLYDTDGTTLLGSAVANGLGAYSIVSSTLGQGTHSLTVKAVDAAGNASGASSALSLTIDTTAPSTPSSAPVLAVASDSGVQGDNTTNVTTPTITGLADPGSTVKLYDTDGTTLLGTAVADGSGAYSIVSSTLSQGTHSLTVKAVDPAGNASSASSALSLTIDTTAPSTPSTAPLLAVSSDSGVQGDNITNVTAPTITGTADPGSTVKLYDTDGTTLLGSAVADGLGAYSIVSSTLGQGVHSLKVKAVDAAGNVSGASPALSLTINTTPPAAPSTPPVLSVASDSGVQGDNLTNVTAPTISGLAGANATVRLYDTNGTTLLGTATADGSGNWSITSSTLAAGAHTLRVTQTDASSNTSLLSPGLSLTIDTAAPSGTAPILTTASDSGAQGDGVTNVTTPTLTGTAEPGSTVRLYDGATLLGATLVAVDGRWSFKSGLLADGVHQITASVTDPAGNLSPTSQAFALTIDSTPPRVTAALLNDTGSSGTDRITADATLAGTGDPTALITIREGTTTLGTVIADGQGRWTFAPTGLAVGVHNLVVSGTDAAGNTGTAQLGFRLDPQAATAPADFINSSSTGVGIARFFDMVTGTTFYTSSLSEYNALTTSRPDLKLESADLTALNPNTVATDPNAVPVYRFFDNTYGTHFFTASTSERDAVIASRADMKFEGVGFFEHTTQQAGDNAVYRFFDTQNGTHFYTTNETERASILSARPDLVDEGIGFYAPKMS